MPDGSFRQAGLPNVACGLPCICTAVEAIIPMTNGGSPTIFLLPGPAVRLCFQWIAFCWRRTFYTWILLPTLGSCQIPRLPSRALQSARNLNLRRNAQWPASALKCKSYEAADAFDVPAVHRHEIICPLSQNVPISIHLLIIYGAENELVPFSCLVELAGISVRVTEIDARHHNWRDRISLLQLIDCFADFQSKQMTESEVVSCGSN